jgi:hypothetical protein
MTTENERAAELGETEGRALIAACSDNDELLAEIQALNWIWSEPYSERETPRVVRATAKQEIMREEYVMRSGGVVYAQREPQ